jgi:hypothetical protein
MYRRKLRMIRSASTLPALLRRAALLLALAVASAPVLAAANVRDAIDHAAVDQRQARSGKACWHGNAI